MPRLIDSPTIIEAAGNKPKKIEEFVGRVNTDDADVSLARMTSPEGWVEPGQTPEFRELTVVLTGCLHVQTSETTMRVAAGKAIICEPGEWVRYSTPDPGGASYIAICLPAFSPRSVHRDNDD